MLLLDYEFKFPPEVDADLRRRGFEIGKLKAVHTKYGVSYGGTFATGISFAGIPLQVEAYLPGFDRSPHIEIECYNDYLKSSGFSPWRVVLEYRPIAASGVYELTDNFMAWFLLGQYPR